MRISIAKEESGIIRNRKMCRWWRWTYGKNCLNDILNTLPNTALLARVCPTGPKCELMIWDKWKYLSESDTLFKKENLELCRCFCSSRYSPTRPMLGTFGCFKMANQYTVLLRKVNNQGNREGNWQLSYIL